MASRKVAIIGTGMVGMSYAYALLNQAVCDELVLVDLNLEKARGEAMDLNHGLAFSSSSMKISAGGYDKVGDADIAVICAGVAQKPGESRIELLRRNAAVFQSVVSGILTAGFNGIFLVATNPVDIMTRITERLSGFDSHRVLGSGTTLDTARLRYLIGEKFDVDPRNVHAYVMGEHGDSEFVPWSQAMIATKPVEEICRDACKPCSMSDLYQIGEEVKGAAQEIIKAKKATYYGIGMALVKITKTILNNENGVLTVSAKMRGEYGIEDVYIGTPAILNRNGVRRVLALSLSDEEKNKLIQSAQMLDKLYKELSL